MSWHRGLARLLHFIGLAMFLGSIFGHIALGALPGAEADAHSVVLSSLAVVHTTKTLTLPGLGLVIVTGVWMTLSYHGGFFRARWLTVHQVLSLLILLNSLVLLRPLGLQVLEVARGLHGPGFDLTSLHTLTREEKTFGAINLVLTLATIAVAVYRPRLLRRTPARSTGPEGLAAGKSPRT